MRDAGFGGGGEGEFLAEAQSSQSGDWVAGGE